MWKMDEKISDKLIMASFKNMRPVTGVGNIINLVFVVDDCAQIILKLKVLLRWEELGVGL